MSKPIELERNWVGGVDLLTEKDAGNLIRIHTGKAEKSLDFWERLRTVCDNAICELEAEIDANETIGDN